MAEQHTSKGLQAPPPAGRDDMAPSARLGHVSDQEDHEVGMLESMRRFPWACAWCLYAVWCVICLSFDVQAANAIVGIPQFRKDFGHAYGDGSDYVLPTHWQSAFNAAPVAAATVASLISAELADRFGRQKVVGGALVISFVAVALEFIATTSPVFFAGKFLNGFMVGTIGTVMVSYIGEVTPLALRGFFTCSVGVSYGIGPLVAFIVINYTGQAPDAWAYRTVFCCQFGFAGVAILLLPFMPESPWWLASKGRTEKALKNLRKLGHSGDEGVKKLALIELTLAQARQESEGVTYLECFRKSNLRRTIISIMPYNIQTFSGIAFVAGYFTYYLQLAGYSTSMSYRLQIAQPVVSIVGNIMAALLSDRVGRRNLTVYGFMFLTCLLLITGGLGTGTSQGMIQGTVAFILLFSWCYNLSIGSTAFSLLCEVSTARLRVKTIAIGYATHAALNVMWQFTIPYMFNPDKGDLGAKIAFVFGGLSFVCILYFWFFQPETSGRSYQELDEMFAKGVPPRSFKGYKTDVQMINETAAGEGKEV